MPNLFVTERCQRKCSFCFAKEGPWNIAEERRDLNIEEVEQIARMYRAHRQTELGIVGGEPLLHPGIGTIVQILSAHGIMPKIFTSGTCTVDETLWESWKPMQSFFVMNLHPPESYTTKEWQNLDLFLRRFHDRIKLGTTIVDPGFSGEYLLEYHQRYGLLPEVRLGIAMPTASGGNAYIKAEDYPAVGGAVLRFVQNAASRGLLVGFDCGYIACMFTEAEIGMLQMAGVQTRFTCEPVIDIGPGLGSWHCFPLAKMLQVSLSTSGVEGTHRAYREMGQIIRRSAGGGVFPRCAGCRVRRQNQCAGGCLGLIVAQNRLTAVQITSLLQAETDYA